MKWERRSFLLFWSTMALSGFLFLEMAVYGLRFVDRPAYGPNIFQICSSWLKAAGFYLGEYLLNALVILTVLHCMWLMGKQVYQTRRCWLELQAAENKELTRRWASTFKLREGDLIVTDQQGLLALTIGLFRPKIVISDGLIRYLKEDELEAVLLHELYHQRNDHPMKAFLTYCASAVFWYIPVIGWWSRYYKITQEVLADRYAIRHKDEASLGSALLKLIQRQQSQAITFAYTAFANTAINYRMKQLVDPKTELKLPLPWSSIMVSTAALTGISGLVLMFTY